MGVPRQDNSQNAILGGALLALKVLDLFLQHFRERWAGASQREALDVEGPIIEGAV
jgi:hypothetical protein